MNWLFEVEFQIAPSMAASVGTRRDAGQAAICLDEISQFVWIEAFIANEDHGLGQKRQQLLGRCRFGALAGEEEQSYAVCRAHSQRRA